MTSLSSVQYIQYCTQNSGSLTQEDLEQLDENLRLERQQFDERNASFALVGYSLDKFGLNTYINYLEVHYEFLMYYGLYLALRDAEKFVALQDQLEFYNEKISELEANLHIIPEEYSTQIEKIKKYSTNINILLESSNFTDPLLAYYQDYKMYFVKTTSESEMVDDLAYQRLIEIYNTAQRIYDDTREEGLEKVYEILDEEAVFYPIVDIMKRSQLMLPGYKDPVIAKFVHFKQELEEYGPDNITKYVKKDEVDPTKDKADLPGTIRSLIAHHIYVNEFIDALSNEEEVDPEVRKAYQNYKKVYDENIYTYLALLIKTSKTSEQKKELEKVLNDLYFEQVSSNKGDHLFVIPKPNEAGEFSQSSLQRLSDKIENKYTLPDVPILQFQHQEIQRKKKKPEKTIKDVFNYQRKRKLYQPFAYKTLEMREFEKSLFTRGLFYNSKSQYISATGYLNLDPNDFSEWRKGTIEYNQKAIWKSITLDQTAKQYWELKAISYELINLMLNLYKKGIENEDFEMTQTAYRFFSLFKSYSFEKGMNVLDIFCIFKETQVFSPEEQNFLNDFLYKLCRVLEKEGVFNKKDYKYDGRYHLQANLLAKELSEYSEEELKKYKVNLKVSPYGEKKANFFNTLAEDIKLALKKREGFTKGDGLLSDNKGILQSGYDLGVELPNLNEVYKATKHNMRSQKARYPLFTSSVAHQDKVKKTVTLAVSNASKVVVPVAVTYDVVNFGNHLSDVQENYVTPYFKSCNILYRKGGFYFSKIDVLSRFNDYFENKKGDYASLKLLSDHYNNMLKVHMNKLFDQTPISVKEARKIILEYEVTFKGLLVDVKSKHDIKKSFTVLKKPIFYGEIKCIDLDKLFTYETRTLKDGSEVKHHMYKRYYNSHGVIHAPDGLTAREEFMFLQAAYRLGFATMGQVCHALLTAHK